ncbi:MAG: ComEC/Rec2 family competence protein [Alphaproteobacteria bacterium]
MTEGGPFDAGFAPASAQPRNRLRSRRLDQQLRHLNDALPLALAGVLGLGVLAYFALPFEPSLRPTVAFGVFSFLVAATLFRRSRLARWLSLLPALAALGFTCAVWQAHRLGDHLLDEPVFDVAITGTVQNVLWRSDGPRFVIGEIEGEPETDFDRLQTVQIKWRGLDDNEGYGRNLLGQRVQWRVTLLPVRGAIVPDGFDFRRQAFFKGLSAYGYSLGPPKILSVAKPPRTENWRQIMRERFMNGLRGDAAGLATALVVGLRGDLSEQAEAEIRAAGLAHILAISGLHIGMVTGALFFFVRLLGAWVPAVSLRLPMHRIAALTALLGAVMYFMISGGSVPTQRATIVVALAMSAILLSRRPFSLRSVGLAALLVMVLQPSALVTASFQMSFAAVVGLIVAFNYVDRRSATNRRAPRRALSYFLGVSVSSLVATAATGIFALYHFQQLSLLGIVANLVAVPLTALWIMPLLMLAALLTPLGLEEPALWLAQFGLDGLLLLASFVATFESGLLTTRDWPPVSLFLASLGLWSGALLVRPFVILSVIPIAASITFAMSASLPSVIVDRGEDLLALNVQAPFLSFGERPGVVYIARGNGFAKEQLGRYFNAEPQECAMNTCVIDDRLWISDSAQIAGHLCLTLPQAIGFTLRAAPRGSCSKQGATDLRSLPRNGSRAFQSESPSRVTNFRPIEAGSQRFWTITPTQ